MLRTLALLSATEVGARLKARVEAVPYYGAASLLAVMGLAFGLLGLFIWLSRLVSPLTASLSIAGGLILVALLLVAWARMRRPPPTAMNRPLTASALALAPTALRIAGRRFSLGTVAAVTVVGLGAVLGRRIARD